MEVLAPKSQLLGFLLRLSAVSCVEMLQEIMFVIGHAASRGCVLKDTHCFVAFAVHMQNK